MPPFYPTYFLSNMSRPRTDPVVPAITAEAARSALEPISYEEYMENDYQLKVGTEFDMKVLYVVYLVARGDFIALTNFLDAHEPEERMQLINTSTMGSYFGNTLHAATYWNTGHEALAIYRYLKANGATAFRDYYDALPWELRGILYIHPLTGVNLGHRMLEEFQETYADIRQHMGDMTG